MYNIWTCNYIYYCYTVLVTKNHNQKKERCLFSLFKFLEEKLFSLSSSSSTRHIIYHYEINDKFFEHFKTRLLFQMNNYSAQHFYVSYFHFGLITNYYFYRFTYISLIVRRNLLPFVCSFHLHNVILIYS